MGNKEKKIVIKSRKKKKSTTPAVKVHHRSSPGPDTRTPWEIGGMSKSKYDKLSRKDKKMLQ